MAVFVWLPLLDEFSLSYRFTTEGTLNYLPVMALAMSGVAIQKEIDVSGILALFQNQTTSELIA